MDQEKKNGMVGSRGEADEKKCAEHKDAAWMCTCVSYAYDTRCRTVVGIPLQVWRSLTAFNRRQGLDLSGR